MIALVTPHVEALTAHSNPYYEPLSHSLKTVRNIIVIVGRESLSKTLSSRSLGRDEPIDLEPPQPISISIKCLWGEELRDHEASNLQAHILYLQDCLISIALNFA